MALSSCLRDDQEASHDHIQPNKCWSLRAADRFQQRQQKWLSATSLSCLKISLTCPHLQTALAVRSAKLAALHSRLSLPSRLPLETLARTLVDASADNSPAFNNQAFARLGHDILGYYTSEYILARYPRLPLTIIFATINGYVGDAALTALSREWGVESAAAPGGEVDPGILQFRANLNGSADLYNDRPFPTEAQKLEEKKTKPWRRGLTSFATEDKYFVSRGRLINSTETIRSRIHRTARIAPGG